MPEILHRLTIRAPLRQVYRALTERHGLAAWWTRDVVADLEVGSVAHFGFNRREVVFRMFVLGLKEDAQVRWRCLGGHPEWKDTEVCFTLLPLSDGTALHFEHRGWKSTDGIFAACNFDWARALASLKAYVETGRGSPHAG